MAGCPLCAKSGRNTLSSASHSEQTFGLYGPIQTLCGLWRQRGPALLNDLHEIPGCGI
jgi:hypothetical protein